MGGKVRPPGGEHATQAHTWRVPATIAILIEDNQIAQFFQQYPWFLLGLFLLPLVLLAMFRRTYPHIPLAIAVAGPGVLSLTVLFWPAQFWFVVAVDGVLATIALADLFTLPQLRQISVERRVGRIASIRQKHTVTLLVTNHSRRALTVWIRDQVPEQCTAVPEQFVVRLAPRSRSVVHYDLKASRRGSFEMETIYLRVRSRLAMWQAFMRQPAYAQIYIYPDMKQLAEYAVLARKNRLSLMGLRRTRRIGQDNEFERLRDFTRDDNYKHIDWRSTARRRKLTVKDFQTNQSQRIIFLMDCGRMMTNMSAELSLLDHALNAMLMMSFVALRQGDAVGLICFSDRVHTFVPLRGGAKQMNHLLHACFDRFPELVESRYDEAFLYLRTHCLKRSLVVLISNIIDEVNSHQLHQHLSALVGRHLPLGVLLRDHQLFDAADAPASAGPEIFRTAAAAEILTWRHQVLTDLEHEGVLVIDAYPEDLTAPLVNRYLEIKARHLL